MAKNLLWIFFPVFFVTYSYNLYSQSCDNCTSTSQINTGLIACYPFNGNANDESGNGNNGTSNGATLTTDRFGVVNKAYYFDGSSYINIPNSSSLKSPGTTGTITIAIWFNVESWFVFGAKYAPLLCKSNNTANTQYRLTVNDNALDVIMNGKQAILSLASTIQLNQWYQIVAVARTNNVTFYLDGAKLGTITYTGTFPSDSTSGLDLGRDYAGSIDYFTGKLDDIRIYNRALSDDEVKQIYAIKPSPPTNVSAGNDVTIVSGSSTQLQGNATGGVSYTWSPAKGLDDSTLLNPMASPDTTTQYILTVANGSCSIKDTVLVTVVKPVLTCDNCVSAIPVNNGLVACYPFNGNTADESGNNNHGTNIGATLTTDRFGQPDKAYYFNGSSYISTPTSSTLQSLTSELSISFWCNVSSWDMSSGYKVAPIICKSNSSTSTQYRLTVNEDGFDLIFNGQRAALTITSLFQLNQWYHVVVVANTTSATFYIDGVSVGNASYSGTYPNNTSLPLEIGRDVPGATEYFTGKLDDLRMYNRMLSASEIMQLNKLEPTPPIINAGSDRSMCLGDSVQFNVPGAVTYLWTPGTGLDDSTIANPYSKPADTVTYIVKGTNGACDDYDTITINVVPIQVDAGAGQDICQGDSFQLNGTALGSFVWSPSSGLSDDHILNPYAQPSASTKYYLTVNNGVCQRKDSVMINVIPALNVSAGNDEKICKGDSVQLNATGGVNYVWTPSTGMSDTSLSNPKVSPDITTQYIVKSGASGCYYYDTIDVEVNPKPLVDAGNDIVGCKGSTKTMNATSSGATDFIWTPTNGLSNPTILNPAVTINAPSVKYVITASNSLTGCFSQDSLLVLADSVHADFTADKTQGLAPLTVNFTNTSYNVSQSFWYFDSSSANAVTATNPQHTFTNSGTYSVKLIVQTSNGCLDSVSEEIIVLTNQSVFIPNVFTPNGDDVNEQFIIGYNEAITKKVTGSIWNRWGGKMYEFEIPGGAWWDGKEKGEYVPSGVYFYIIYVEDIFGSTKGFKGTVTLLR